MSDTNKILEEINGSINSDRGYVAKEKELKQARIDSDYEKKLEIEHNKKVLQGLNLEDYSEKRIKDLQASLEEYFDACNHCKVFINDAFRGFVPFFRKNLILMGAVPGAGKSTTTANIALSTIMQGEKCLVITNEERPEDVYGRVVALIRGWSYTKHENFTEEQKKITIEMTAKLAEKLIVVDQSFGGLKDATTTYEGFSQLMDSIIANNNKFGCIIIDYYQNIRSSKLNPNMEKHAVLDKVSGYLDTFKNIYSAPIVLLSQLTLPGKDNSIEFADRIGGRKIIFEKCTTAIEIKAIRDKGLTEFVFHKSRFSESVGKSIICGFDKGRYVKYDADYIRNMERNDLDKLKAK